MASKEARTFAYFIVDKLGLPYTKAEIIRYADESGISSAWDRFVTSNKLYREVAEANRIKSISDVEWFFRDASYAGMRATFPAKSHGRTIIGPHIVSLQKYKEQKNADKAEREKYRVNLKELRDLNSSVGRSVIHSADNGVAYGKGVIVGVNEKNSTVIVEFENGLTRGLSLKFCLDKGFIRFV